MLPVLFRVGPIAVGTHDFFVLAGVLTAVAVLALRPDPDADRSKLPYLVAGGLLGGAIVAKLGTGWQYMVMADEPSLVGLWLHGGQSVLGGLAGAYGGVLLTKRLVGYRRSTGDWFAPAVAAGIAVGRIGCFLTEQVGTPTTLPWGISLDPETSAAMAYCPSCSAGLPMHPSFLYEIAFHAIAFFVLIKVSGSIGRPGDSFKWYLISYAVFRFGVEFVRDNPVLAWGLSGSQLFLLMTIPLGIALVWRRSKARAPVPLEVAG